MKLTKKNRKVEAAFANRPNVYAVLVGMGVSCEVADAVSERFANEFLDAVGEYEGEVERMMSNLEEDIIATTDAVIKALRKRWGMD